MFELQNKCFTFKTNVSVLKQMFQFQNKCLNLKTNVSFQNKCFTFKKNVLVSFLYLEPNTSTMEQLAGHQPPCFVSTAKRYKRKTLVFVPAVEN